MCRGHDLLAAALATFQPVSCSDDWCVPPALAAIDIRDSMSAPNGYATTMSSTLCSGLRICAGINLCSTRRLPGTCHAGSRQVIVTLAPLTAEGYTAMHTTSCEARTLHCVNSCLSAWGLLLGLKGLFQMTWIDPGAPQPQHWSETRDNLGPGVRDMGRLADVGRMHIGI